MKIGACIPSIGLSLHLQPLVDVLCGDGVAVRVYVNQQDVTFDPPMDDCAHRVDMVGCTIYEEWNDAAADAANVGAYLLCVTDDVAVAPGMATELAAALDCRPDYGLVSTDIGCTVGHHAPSDVQQVSHQAGSRYQFATWCFMARPEAWQNVDSRYKIWYGDDDLLWKVNAAGWKTGYLQGLGASHYTSTTCNQLPWTLQAAGEDGLLWASEH